MNNQGGVEPISMPKPKPSCGNVKSKTLSDVTNSLLLSQPRSASLAQIPSTISKEFVDKLIKENMGMMKLIEDQKKLLGFSGAELQKMRMHLQKFKLQNWNLAQSNSQMQAEVNVARDRLKAMHHELACKEALLKAKRAREEKRDADMSKVLPEVKDEVTNLQPLQEKNDEKTNHDNRKCTIRSRSRSMSSSTSIKHEQEAAKRPCLRRQSARFKSEQPENLFQIENIKSSANQRKTQTPLRQSSLGGRLARKAAEKVHSYREMPLNVKLRREV